MVSKPAIFRYKTDKGRLHRLPPLLKLFLFLPLSVFCFSLPFLWLSAGIIIAILTAFMCKFTLQEQLTDIKPAVFYAVLMYALSVFSSLFEYFSVTPPASLTALIFAPNPDFIKIAMRLFLMVQLCALLFRTTSSIEIRQSLFSVERFIKRLLSRLPIIGKFISQNMGFSDNISLFLSFIPQIFSTWSTVSLAWKARGGKKYLADIKTLIFILIIQSFEKAAIKAKALEAREN